MLTAAEEEELELQFISDDDSSVLNGGRWHNLSLSLSLREWRAVTVCPALQNQTHGACRTANGRSHREKCRLASLARLLSLTLSLSLTLTLSLSLLSTLSLLYSSSLRL